MAWKKRKKTYMYKIKNGVFNKRLVTGSIKQCEIARNLK